MYDTFFLSLQSQHIQIHRQKNNILLIDQFLCYLGDLYRSRVVLSSFCFLVFFTFMSLLFLPFLVQNTEQVTLSFL